MPTLGLHVHAAAASYLQLLAVALSHPWPTAATQIRAKREAVALQIMATRRRPSRVRMAAPGPCCRDSATGRHPSQAMLCGHARPSGSGRPVPLQPVKRRWHQLPPARPLAWARRAWPSLTGRDQHLPQACALSSVCASEQKASNMRRHDLPACPSSMWWPIVPLIFIDTDHNQYNQARHDPCHRCDFIQFQSLLDVRSGISVLLTELLPDTPLFIFSGSKVHKSCPAYLSSFHTVFFIQKYKIVAHVMVSSFCRFIKFSLCLHRSCNSHPL